MQFSLPSSWPTSFLLFGWTQQVAESLTASRFSALKGLQMIARGKGAQRPPPRVWIDIKFAPLPAV
jgi:hypothetical protein